MGICAVKGRIVALILALGAAFLLYGDDFGESFKINPNHSISIATENDVYFEPFVNTDRFYTAGHSISYLSPEYADSWLNNVAIFSHLYGKNFARFGVKLTQELYTPDDKYKYDFTPPTRDILFGAALYASAEFISRTRDFAEQISLDLGVIGPLALGRQAQNGIHKLTNNRQARGWDYQLKNEPLVNLHYGIIYRWVFIEDFFDILPWASFSLGNANVSISAGAKMRIGYGLRNDFGYQKVKSRFAQIIADDGFKIYAFFGAQGSLVGRDIFIEGNTGKNGRKSSVRIKHELYAFEAGAMVGYKYFSIGYVWSNESPRFKEQRGQHKYGSLRIEIMF